MAQPITASRAAQEASVTVRALCAFYVNGVVHSAGAVLEVSRPVAAELVASNKAVLSDAADTAAPPKKPARKPPQTTLQET